VIAGSADGLLLDALALLDGPVVLQAAPELDARLAIPVLLSALADLALRVAAEH
jgi:hypothetical protein